MKTGCGSEPYAPTGTNHAFDWRLPHPAIIGVTGIFTARAGSHLRTGVRTMGIEKNEWTRHGAEGFLVRDIPRKGPL